MRRDKRYVSLVRIRAIGVGGGGGNAIGRMMEHGIEGVDYVAVNTDAQTLDCCAAPTRLCIGGQTTAGQGSGGDPQVGERAALESYDEIQALLQSTDMLFITAGLGGGTGTGASVVIAQAARQLGILTIAVVTLPFYFEGGRRSQNAILGMEKLRAAADTLIAIPNDRLVHTLPEDTSVDDAFRAADDVLRQGVQGISEFVTVPGFINLDFADVRAVISVGGATLISTGRGAGADRARAAAGSAITSEMLNMTIEGARGALVNVAGGSTMTLNEVELATRVVKNAVDPDAKFMFGTVVDESLGDELRVTVVATGFDQNRAWRMSNHGMEPGGTEEAASGSNVGSESHLLNALAMPAFLQNLR